MGSGSPSAGAATPPSAATGEAARYLPRCVLAELAHRPLPAEPLQRSLHGAVLIADIAGFSQLTEGFAARGPEGAEQLAAVLDAWFGRMTETALDHGGDVVDFIGDALVVTWTGEDANTALLRAVHCAMALREAGREVADGTGLALQQRLALDYGELSLFGVGGLAQQWHWLVAGAAVARAAAAYGRGAPGDIVIGASAWPLLAAHCSGQRLPGGGDRRLSQVHRERPAALPQAELPATPDRAAWPGEFRALSTLMLGLPDLDPAAGDALAQLQAAVHCTQEILQRGGGRIERLSMDDKGISILAAWGLPQSSHADDAQRALRAGHDLLQALQQRNIAAAAGVASGAVFCGDSGGRRRRHLCLAGASVNRAARLMQQDQGLLCDADTARAAARLWDCPPAGDGGALRPQPREPVVPLHETALLGREEERQLIEQALQYCVAGFGGALALIGEAGIGKSRLLADTAARAASRLQVLASAGAAVEASTPYYPWRQLLRRLLPEQTGTGLQQLLEAQLAGHAQLQRWLPLLNDILPLRLPDNELTPQITGAARARSLQELLIRLLLEQARARPLLLLLDDLHWWDEASLALLDALLPALPQALVLAASRPEAEIAETAGAGLRRLLESHPRLLRLEALPRDAAAALAARTLGVATLAEPLADLLYQRSAGNPFFCEELALALRDAGLVEIAGDRAQLHSDLASEEQLAQAPTTLRGTLVSRYDRLQPAAQATLKLASVIGREVDADTLAALLDDVDVAAALSELRDSGLLRPGSAEGETHYHFKHALLRDVIYELLPFAQRRLLHRRVAQRIESGGAAGAQAAELAMHWESAGDIAAALRYLEQAAQGAYARYANREAIRHIRRAYTLADTQPDPPSGARIAEWEAILGDAHQELFEYGPSVQHYHRALELMQRPGQLGGLRRALLVAKEAAIQLRHRRRPPPREPDAQRLARLARAAHIHQRLVESAFFDNRPAELLYQTLASVNLAEKTDFTYVRVSSYAGLAMACMAMGRHALADDYSRRSMLASNEGSAADVAYSHLGRMVYQVSRGGWALVHESYAAGTPLYRSLGISGRWQQIRSIDLMAWFSQGDLDQAEAGLREILEQPGTTLPAQIQAWCWAYDSLCAALRGPDAHDRLQTLLQQFGRLPLRDMSLADRMLCVGTAAQAHWILGEPQLALAHADEALRLAHEAPPATHYLVPGLVAVSRVYFAACARADAPAQQAELLRKAGDLSGILRRMAWLVPVAGPRALLLRAAYTQLRGNSAGATRLYRRALAEALRYGMPYEQAQALQALGGEESRAQAQAIHERMGAVPLP